MTEEIERQMEQHMQEKLMNDTCDERTAYHKRFVGFGLTRQVNPGDMKRSLEPKKSLYVSRSCPQTGCI